MEKQNKTSQHNSEQFSDGFESINGTYLSPPPFKLTANSLSDPQQELGGNASEQTENVNFKEDATLQMRPLTMNTPPSSNLPPTPPISSNPNQGRVDFTCPIANNLPSELRNISLRSLMRLYLFDLNENLNFGRGCYSRDWALSSTGSGLIRQSIRERISSESVHNRSEGHLLTVLNSLPGEARRKEQLRLLIRDVFASPTWRIGDQLEIRSSWTPMERRYAQFWNAKGGLITRISSSLGINRPFALAGVMAAESGINHFQNGRAIARFESHIFWDRWANESNARKRLFRNHFRSSRPQSWRPNSQTPWQSYHGDQQKEWDALNFARTLGPDANLKAIESTSFGIGQIMGFNFARLSFSSPFEMLDCFNSSEGSQIVGIADFIMSVRSQSTRTRIIRNFNRVNENGSNSNASLFLPMSTAYGPRDPQAHATRSATAVRILGRLISEAASTNQPTPE